MSKGQGHVWSEELKWLSGLEKQQSTFTQSPPPPPLTIDRDSLSGASSFRLSASAAPEAWAPLWHLQMDTGAQAELFM